MSGAVPLLPLHNLIAWTYFKLVIGRPRSK